MTEQSHLCVCVCVVKKREGREREMGKRERGGEASEETQIVWILRWILICYIKII